MPNMHIFISYGRGDALDFARKLAAWMKVEGFVPWLDVDEGIPIGSPFDVKIELAIEGSDLLIALLSPRSLRPEGFCRNELLYAQAKKCPIIPVRIADVTPPIQIISLNYLDACSNPDAVFHRLSAVIQQVAKNGQMALRDWPLLTGGKPWWASQRQLSFEEELARHGGSFIGREWLFHQLREWIAGTNSRFLLLTADAGIGKSAVAAQMTARLNVRGVHFCSRSQSDSCRVRSWLRDLIHQLASQFPCYARLLGFLGPPAWEEPPVSLFRTLVAQPLVECRSELDIADPWVFVIDALDESVAEAGPDLADLLADSAERLPPWFRIIATSRPDRSLMARFRLDNVHLCHLNAECGPNREDLAAYVHERLERMAMIGAVEVDVTALTSRLCDLADGNFLFAKMTLDALADPDEKSRLRLASLGGLPKKLGGLYNAMFRRRFPNPDRYEAEVLPLLDCLVVARAPVPEALLVAASGLDGRTAQQGLRQLSQFLSADTGNLRLFHQSVADWLMDDKASGEFAALPTSGHKRLAQACWGEYQADPEKMSEYGLRHLPSHLASAERMEDLVRTLLEYTWLQAKTSRGLVHELVQDYQESLSALQPSHPQRRPLELVMRSVRLSSHILCSARDQLASQLVGRMCGFEEPEIRRLVKAAGGLQGKTWLRPLTQTLSSPGGPLLRTMEGHGRCVWAVAVTPDSQFAISGAFDKTVKVWCLDSGVCVRTLKGHTWWVGSVALTPNGRQVVSGCLDGTLRIWDLESGACLRTLEGHTGAAKAVTVSGDNRRVISGSDDRTLKVWDLESGACLQTLEGHADSIRALAAVTERRWVVSGSADKTLKVWDLESGVCLWTLQGHADSVRAVAITADRHWAISASDDKTLRVWDLESGACLRTLVGHRNPVMAVAVTPDGKQAVSGSSDRTLKVWDLKSGVCLRTFEGHADSVRTVTVTADGLRIVSGGDDETVRIWDLSSDGLRGEPERHQDRVDALKVTMDGRRAVTGSGDNTIRVWDMASGACLRTLAGHTGEVKSISVTPDGRRAVSGASDSALCIWDLEKGNCLQRLEGHGGPVGVVTLTPDGRRVLSGARDRTLRVWDLESGVCLQVLTGHQDAVDAIAVTPDGRQAISAGRDNTLRVWELETGVCEWTLQGHVHRVWAVAVTPDGRRVVSGSWDATVNYWDLESGVCLRTLQGHGYRVWSVAVTPDGQQVVSGSSDNTLKVWDLQRGTCLQTLEGHRDRVAAIAVTSDGRRAISGSWDKTFRVWALESGNAEATFTAEAEIHACAVGSDGQFVAGDRLGHVHFLRLESQDVSGGTKP